MIVKIQRPLMTNGNNEPMALIYDEPRAHMLLMPWHQCEELFDDDELRIYVEVEIQDKKLHIGDRVEGDF